MMYRPHIGRGRRGVVAPFMAISLIGLLGVAAIAVDGAMILVNRRAVQSAADAASLAAAIELFTNSSSGLDSSGKAAKSAKFTATDNGFTDGVDGTTVTVHIPPTSGAYTGKPGYAEVIVTMQQPRYFSSIFGVSKISVSARAVARGTQRPRPNGIIVLDPSHSNSLATSASGNINVRNADIIVDSSDVKGGTISNSGNIMAENMYFTGNPGYYSSNSGKFIATNGKIYSSQAPTVDPLKDLPPPPLPLARYNNVNISGLPRVGGSVPGYPDPNNPNGWVLPAGVYYNGIHISDNNASHTYTLESGIFYFSGGGLTLSANAAINCQSAGVLMYFAGGGGLSMTAGGPVTLSPMTTGPYANITIYENRANTSQNSITGQTNGSLNITGTVYTPAAKFTLTGSGSNYAIGSQYIVYQLVVTGSGNFNVDYPSENPATRNLYLAE